MKSALPKSLTSKEITKKLGSLEDWTLNKRSTEISKIFPQESFIKGLAFVAKVTVHAEILNHHPDIELSYPKVKIKLTTHEAKGLTKSDFDLAKRIDGLAKRVF